MFPKIKWRYPLLLGLIASISLLFSVATYREYSGNRIAANIFVGQTNFAGKTYDEAAELLRYQSQEIFEKPISIVYNGQTYEFSAHELGIEIDTFKTMEKVYLEGHGDSLFKGTANLLTGIFEENVLDPIVFVDDQKFEQALKEKIPELNNIPTLKVTIKGSSLNTDLKKAIQSSLFASEEPSLEIETTLEQPETVEAETPTQPKVSETESQEEGFKRPETHVEQPFTFRYNDGQKEYTYLLRFTKDWIDFSQPDDNGVYNKIDTKELLKYIRENIASEIDIESQNAALKSMPAQGSDYAQVEGIAKSGRRVFVADTVKAFYDAIEQGLHETNLVVEEIPGKIINQTAGTDLGKLELIGAGRSNFETSPAGRDFNVRKGLNEKVNSIMIPPGGEYNYNKNLGPVTNAAGWKNSLAIFGGTNLVPVPGGGLCQVSTTVYRAALDAGFKISERSPHSLYVHYYQAYGDGLDATIYPGVRNFKFLNDTPNWILIQAYDDGFDANVNVYGTPDGRKVELKGPFYGNSEIPQELQGKLSVRHNQVGWLQTIKKADGTFEENALISSYRNLYR